VSPNKKIRSYTLAYTAFLLAANIAFAYQAVTTKLVTPTSDFAIWQFEFLKPAVLTVCIALCMGFVIWRELKSEQFLQRKFWLKAACFAVLFLFLPGMTAASIAMSSNYGLGTHSMGCSD